MTLINKDERLKKSDRVLKRDTFVRAAKQKYAKKSGHFIVIELKGSEGERKLGVTASKRVGGAVKRNRVKRLVREFFRRNKEKIRPDTYYIVIARKNSHTLGYSNVFEELSRLMF